VTGGKRKLHIEELRDVTTYDKIWQSKKKVMGEMCSANGTNKKAISRFAWKPQTEERTLKLIRRCNDSNRPTYL
jgi:hypothetical protein